MSAINQFSNEYLEEHTLQIGRVVLAAAMLDDLISTFIADFLGLEDYQENALLRPLQSRAKVDLLQRLTNHYLDKDTAKSMSPVFQSARDALEERNALIHGVPTEMDGQIAFVSWVGKNKLVGAPDLWPVQRVCCLAQTFITLGDGFEYFVEQFRASRENGGEFP